MLFDLIELTSDAVVMTNASGILTAVNETASQLLGYTRTELLGQPIANLVVPEDRLRLTAALIARGTQILQWNCLQKDTSAILIEARTKVLPDGQWIAFLRDISKAQQDLEHVLHDKEQQLRQLSDSLPQLVWITNAGGVLEYVNQQWCQYSGLTLEQSRDPELMANYHHPDDMQRVFEQWAIALETQQPYEVEGRLKRSDGIYRWFLMRAVPALDAKGQVLRWYGTSTEIHDRKQAELNEKFLNDLDLRLRQLSTATKMEWETVRGLGEYLKVDRCLWSEIDWENRLIAIHQDWHQEGLSSHAGTYSLTDFISPELQAAHAAGEPVVLSDVTTHPDSARSSTYQQLGIGALLSVPCIQQGRWVVALSVNTGTARQWQPDEVALLQATVARLWSLIEQTRMVQALRDSEVRFRTLADNISQLAWIADASGWIFWYNQRWFDYTGTTLEEMQGWGWQQVHDPDYVDRVTERFHRHLETGEVWEDTFPLRSRDGQYRWFLSRAIPIRNEQGQVMRWFGTNTDITDRKQAELDLQARNHYIELLYETTRDLLSTNRPLALVETVFAKLQPLIGLDVYINYMLDEAQQMLHLQFYGGILEDTARDIEWLELGRAVCGTVAQNRCQMVQPNLQQSTDPQTELVRSLGLTAYSCQPLVAQGKIFGTLGFGSCSRTAFTPAETGLFQAICDQIAIALERSQLMSSLQQQTEELQRVNRLKDDFFSALSHELRTPLNPILGWTKLLQAQKLPPLKVTQALETIERNTRQQISLVDDLLDVARVIRGGLQLDSHPIDLTLALSTAIDTVQFAAQAKSIAIEYQPTTAIYTNGDGDRLQQIFWNLLSNAIKFTPDGGRVEVRLEQVTAEAGEQGSRRESQSPVHSPTHPLTYPSTHPPLYAQITITDTGIGISAEFLPHVFEYFRQVEGGSTRSYNGLGLGLAIVRHLVELHGGIITATSLGLGQGATFTVRLPLLQGNRTQASAIDAGNLVDSSSFHTSSTNSSSINFRSTDSSCQPIPFSASRVESDSQILSPLGSQTLNQPLLGPPAAPPSPSVLPSRIQVLVLDDEPDNLALVQFLLEQEGLSVVAVTSPFVALEAIAQSPPDLLVSDIGMPEMDGYEFIQRVRAMPSRQRNQIPAIALTAFAQPEDQERAIESGFQAFIPKPVDPLQVIETVTQFIV